MATIVVEARVFGRRRHAPPPFTLTLEPATDPRPHKLALRDLITRIVDEEVAATGERRGQQRIYPLLTAQERTTGKRTESMSTGGGTDEIEASGAAATALQAFEDGLYLALVDGIQVTSLESQAELSAQSKVTFVRVRPPASR